MTWNSSRYQISKVSDCKVQGCNFDTFPFRKTAEIIDEILAKLQFDTMPDLNEFALNAFKFLRTLDEKKKKQIFKFFEELICSEEYEDMIWYKQVDYVFESFVTFLESDI